MTPANAVAARAASKNKRISFPPHLYLRRPLKLAPELDGTCSHDPIGHGIKPHSNILLAIGAAIWSRNRLAHMGVIVKQAHDAFFHLLFDAFAES